MIKIKNIKYWVWLSLLKGIGSKKCLTLLEKYQTPEKIYHLTKEELVNVKGIGETTADIISSQVTKQKIDKHLQYLEKNQIEVIHIQDKSYPPLLKEIYDPPIVIYLKGNKNINRRQQGKHLCNPHQRGTCYRKRYARYNFKIILPEVYHEYYRDKKQYPKRKIRLRFQNALR